MLNVDMFVKDQQINDIKWSIRTAGRKILLIITLQDTEMFRLKRGSRLWQQYGRWVNCYVKL